MNTFFNNIQIFSPLDQFEIRNLLSIDLPVLGNLQFSLTNIGLYLIIGTIFIILLGLLSTNYNKLVGDNWSISQEALNATILNTVVGQINPKEGQKFFPFIYTLFIFILINNLIGLVIRCLWILSLFILNYSKKFYFSRLNFNTDSQADKPRYSFNNKNTFYLNPDYITGFTDGEGCFSVSIYKESRVLTGWQVKAIFSISLHDKDVKILEAIQRTFKVGKIYKHGENSLQYRVSSLKDLKVIIEHFDKYPLITQKKADYLLFKEVVNLLKQKEHLKLDPHIGDVSLASSGLQKIVNIKASLNLGLSENLKNYFPETKLVDRSVVEFTGIKSLNWIRGFIEAEGSFQVISQEINNKTSISLRFSVTQHTRDEVLLKNIVTYLNLGRYYKSPTRPEGQYLVTKFSDISNKVIPLINEYPLLGVKNRDYLDFVQIAELIKSKDHLTKEGIKKIMLIKNNMNSKRTYEKEE